MSETEKNPFDEFGEGASTDPNAGFKKPFKLEDDSDNFFVILPATGRLKKDAVGWRRFIKRHWGYFMARDDGDKMRITFNCIEKKNKNKMVVKECPQCTLYNERKDEMEALKSELISKKKSKKEVKAALEPYAQWMRDFNRESKWYMNVIKVDEEGRPLDYGQLAISHKCFMELESKMKTYEQKLKRNIVSMKNAIVWNFHRTGSAKFAQSMTDSVDVARDADDKVLTVNLTAEQAQMALDACIDPENDMNTLELTFEQIRALTETEGDEDAVRRIVKPNDQAEEPETDDEEDDSEESSPPPAAKKSAPSKVSESEDEDEDDEEDDETESSPAAATSNDEEDEDGDVDEEFMKKLKIKPENLKRASK